MAFKVVNTEYNPVQEKYQVVGTADAESDIATVSTDYAAGSVVLVTADDFPCYVFSVGGTWVKKSEE